MDDFSSSDGFRAFLTPFFSSCLPSLRLSDASSSGETLSGPNGSTPANEGEGVWYHQSSERGRAEEQWDASDALSLHEASGSVYDEDEAEGGSRRRRRLRPRGGDVSGGGADTGSGLTRWTLLKSWWRGGSGAIRLPDSEDEDEAANVNAQCSASTGQFALEDADNEPDAVSLELDDIALPPAPPFAFSSSSHPDPTPLSPVPSDSTTLVDASTTSSAPSIDREERRARRRARRHARELGISVEEFEQGVPAAVEPETSGASLFLDVKQASGKGNSSRSSRSSGSSRSRGEPREERSKGEPHALAEDDGNGELVEIDDIASQRSSEGRKSRRHRSRRDKHVDFDASRFEDGVEWAHLSPASDPHLATDHPRRSKHRSQSSTSTSSTFTTTASSDARSSSHHSSRKHRSHPSPSAEASYEVACPHPPPSPLHLDASNSTQQEQYYQDETGQLQPYHYSHPPPSTSTHFLDPAQQQQQIIYLVDPSTSAYIAAESPVSPSYAHIGVLPPASPSLVDVEASGVGAGEKGVESAVGAKEAGEEVEVEREEELEDREEEER